MAKLVVWAKWAAIGGTYFIASIAGDLLASVFPLAVFQASNPPAWLYVIATFNQEHGDSPDFVLALSCWAILLYLYRKRASPLFVWGLPVVPAIAKIGLLKYIDILTDQQVNTSFTAYFEDFPIAYSGKVFPLLVLLFAKWAIGRQLAAEQESSL